MNNLNFNLGMNNNQNKKIPTNLRNNNNVNLQSNNNQYDSNLKYYLMTILTVYFLTKIVYPLFYNMPTQTLSSKEMINLSAATILAYVVYELTGLANIQLHWLFYLGIIIGMNYPAFYHRVIEPREHGTVSSQLTQNLLTSILYIKLLVLIIIFLYVGMTSDPGYLLYFGGVILLLIGTILAKKGFHFWQDRDKKTGQHTSVWHRSAGEVLKFGLSFTSWLLALLFIYPKDSPLLTAFLQFIFGGIMGVFIANMSYQGPDYFVESQPTSKCQDKEDCDRKFNLTTNLTNQDLQDSIVNLKWALIFTIVLNIVLLTLYYMRRE